MEFSDLSLSMPMLSFTPVFLIGTSSLLLHEVPSAAGIAGIGIMVSGSYVLNIFAEHEYVLDPLKSMVQNRGTWYLLIVALLFAISINEDKIAMLNPGPALWHGIHSADCQRCVCGHRYPLQKICWILFPASVPGRTRLHPAFLKKQFFSSMPVSSRPSLRVFLSRQNAFRSLLLIPSG